MELSTVLERLRAHEGELRAAGVARLSVFGSLARGQAGEDSDVDLAVMLDPQERLGLAALGRLERRLAAILDAESDLVSEPVRLNPRLQAEIDRDRVVAF
jgi:predicted nucleotidyltransferase